MTFKFEAKYGLLTYAQCQNLDPFRVVTLLSELGAECIVGRENHADGGTHLHAFFMFEEKYATRNQRIFDIDGCHPNIVRGYGTPEKGWDYATKDGDIVGGGLERPCRIRTNPQQDKWAEIILAESREDFFKLIADLDPRSLCVNFGNLEKYADWKYRPTIAEYSNPGGISFPEERVHELNAWVDENIFGNLNGMTAPMPPRGGGENTYGSIINLMLIM